MKSIVCPTVQNGGHGDELGLHAPPGAVFRVVEGALERDALDGGQLVEDFRLVSSSGRLSRMVIASSESRSRTPSATVAVSSSSRISSRTASSTSVRAAKSKSTRREARSGAGADRSRVLRAGRPFPIRGSPRRADAGARRPPRRWPRRRREELRIDFAFLVAEGRVSVSAHRAWEAASFFDVLHELSSKGGPDAF